MLTQLKIIGVMVLILLAVWGIQVLLQDLLKVLS